MTTTRLRVSPPGAGLPIAALLVLAACASDERAGAPAARAALPADAELEFIAAPITSLDERDGVVAVGLGPMARWFAIHPELSPDPVALAAFARRAHADEREVHATVWVRARPAKAPPGRAGAGDDREPWPWVVVRLADTPDPRASDPR